MAYLPPPIQHTVSSIYALHEGRQSTFESAGIGFSALGEECDRRIWYAFRHAFHPERKEGRIVRLLGRGNREEERIIGELVAIGCTVTDQQKRVSLCDGHLRGKIEGKLLGLPEAPKTAHVFEIKTHNEKSFKEVAGKGVREAKYEHWVQLTLGMRAENTERGVYIAENKNTDELHEERLKYDHLEAMRLEARADRIIKAHQPPPKLHEDPNGKMAFKCRFCPARGICHEGEMPRRGCRTCLHSTPVKDGWTCAKYGLTFDVNSQVKDCPKHRFLPSLVPGEQIDADLAADTVTYRLADGSTWVDCGEAA